MVASPGSSAPSSPPPSGEREPSLPRFTLPPTSPQARRVRVIVTALLVLTLATAIGGTWAYHTLPQRVDPQQTLVLGQTRFAPGAEGAVRVAVRDARTGEAVPNAQVKVSLAPEGGGKAVPLFTGQAGHDGALAATFQVPPDAQPAQTLIVDTRSGLGRDQVRQAVAVKRSYKLLLTTDKPVYQPAQTIHLRALALSTLDMRAVEGADIGFLVEDPKGNKVFRQTVKSSPFGVAAADFTLADEVTNGNYKITASLGDTTSEKTVSVRPYVLPKFAVKVSTGRTFYLPGQRVEGAVQCDYFFGKPAADAQVEIVASVFDVQTTTVANIRGRTDENGTYRFEFDLPPYFAGRGLEQDQAEFSLQVDVVDQAAHTEQTSKVLPIAQAPIVIEVVPEAGVLKPGVENRLYILTSYPDGTPAPSRLELTLNGQRVHLATGEYGLAEHAFVPSPQTAHLSIVATDDQGQSAHKALDLGVDRGAGVVLLRPDRATYHLGDTMHLVALTSQSWGSIFLDIVKDGHTLSTRSLPVEDGRAECAVDLSGDLFGALALHAYKVLGDGSIILDTRVVVVDAPRDLATDIRADREVYRPGETARLSFLARTAAGPVPSALGVAIVDESVFAVMEQDPGFAKLYFLLQKELLEPKYQIKGFTLPEVLTKTQSVELQATQDQAARAAWAPLEPAALTMNANSRPLKLEAAQQERQAGVSGVSNLVLALLILLPAGLWLTAILGLRATGSLGKALGRFGLAVLALIFGAPLAGGLLFTVLVLLSGGLAYDLGLRIVALLLVGFLLGWLASLVAFAVYAWHGRDERARIVWLLVVAWVVLGVVLAATLALNASPNAWLSAVAVLAYLGGLLALLFFGVGLYLEGRRWAAVSAVALVLLFVPAMIAAALLPEIAAYGVLARTLGNPVVYAGPLGWLSGCAPAGLGERGSGLLSPRLGLMDLAKSSAPAAEAPPPKSPDAPAAAQAPRVRQFFPETLLWLPELQTDAGGFAELDVPLADSITTWRVTALASTQDGQLGFSNAALRVFQDFFVDIDLPVALTQNDEVAIPVAIYNYLPEAQNVRLEVTPAAWFELQDAGSRSLEIAANDIDVVYFRIKVIEFGEQAFEVMALGDRMSDAIKRQVAVVPDGRRFRHSHSDWLRESTTITTTMPAQAIPGTARLEVKVYPGVVSQIVEGLESILKLPYG